MYLNADSDNYKDEFDLFVGTDLSAANNLNILAEMLVRRIRSTDDVDLIEGRIGYRYRPVDNLYTILGMGYGFNNSNPEFRFFLSFTFAYPSKKKEIKKIYEEEHRSKNISD